MGRWGTTLRRRLVFAVLVAVSVGPTGIGGVLHPFDDFACLPVGAERTPTLSTATSPTLDGDLHCITCHLIRGMRWGLSSSAAPSVRDQPAAPHFVAPQSDHSHDPQAALPGRSPPSLA
jgi:hypothetical protein